MGMWVVSVWCLAGWMNASRTEDRMKQVRFQGREVTVCSASGVLCCDGRPFLRFESSYQSESMNENEWTPVPHTLTYTLTYTSQQQTRWLNWLTAATTTTYANLTPSVAIQLIRTTTLFTFFYFFFSLAEHVSPSHSQSLSRSYYLLSPFFPLLFLYLFFFLCRKSLRSYSLISFHQK